MEMMTLPKFDHSGTNLEKSLSLTQKETHYVKNAIVFESLACPMLVGELFNEEEDAPLDMRSMTGILERVNGHMRNANEQMYMFMIFGDGYYHIQETIEESHNKVKEAEEKGKKADTNSLEDLLQTNDSNPSVPLANSIEAIRKCNYDFEKYISAVMKDEDYDENGDYCKVIEITGEQIGDFLKDLLKKALDAKNEAEKKNKEKKDDQDNKKDKE